MNLGGKNTGDIPREQVQRDRIIRFKKVFGTPEGKEVLFDILDRCHVLDTQELSPFEQGKRSIGLRIVTDLNINLADFDRLLKGEI